MKKFLFLLIASIVVFSTTLNCMENEDKTEAQESRPGTQKCTVCKIKFCLVGDVCMGCLIKGVENFPDENPLEVSTKKAKATAKMDARTRYKGTYKALHGFNPEMAKIMLALEMDEKNDDHESS